MADWAGETAFRKSWCGGVVKGNSKKGRLEHGQGPIFLAGHEELGR